MHIKSPRQPTATFSFIVGSRYGPRSSEWIVTADQEDTYITAAKFRKQWKATLHKSGRWHIKWLTKDDRAPILKLHKSEMLDPDASVGLFIVIPDDSLRPASDPDRLPEPSIWLPRPTYGGVTEIAIADWYPKSGAMQWPGQQFGTAIFAIFKTSESRALALLVRQFDRHHPVALSYLEQRLEYQPFVRPIVLDSPERRGVFFGRTRAGSMLIAEFAID